MTNEQTNQNNDKELGAIWIKQSKKGNEYMSGKITSPGGEEFNVVIFPNTKKTKETQPDYRIYLSEPRPETQETAPRPQETPAKSAEDEEIF